MFVWGVSDGAQKQKWKAHDGPINALAYSQDGKFLMSASSDNKLQIWSTTGYKKHKELCFPASIIRLKTNPKNNLVAGAFSDGSIRIWDSTDFSLKRTLQPKKHKVAGLAWGPEGKMLLAGNANGNTFIWEILP
ncbi:MAG TPA: hypothetical protein DCE42_26525 [Myxococcales bacterium]|nr:hypothetical protein [Myxococcales bacterium]